MSDPRLWCIATLLVHLSTSLGCRLPAVQKLYRRRALALPPNWRLPGLTWCVFRRLQAYVLLMPRTPSPADDFTCMADHKRSTPEHRAQSNHLQYLIKKDRVNIRTPPRVRAKRAIYIQAWIQRRTPDKAHSTMQVFEGARLCAGMRVDLNWTNLPLYTRSTILFCRQDRSSLTQVVWTMFQTSMSIGG